MHHAVRADENPALDTAVALGTIMDCPLLVYQGLSGNHPFNSDRHHTFILEGARDVHFQLKERGIRHAFHLGQNPSIPGPLRNLIDTASVVVTEDYPAPPFKRWTQRLHDESSTPFLLVDAHCILPMQQVGKGYGRAYHFRNRIGDEVLDRASRAWPLIDATPASPSISEVGFEPIDWESARICDLVAACQIDHSIGPVPHTVGGSLAGYSRWGVFLEHGLTRYARHRNDPTAEHGVSRMSAYLHHGHVSPFRLAREAAIKGSEGATKFLDELLIWRELAFNLCFYNDGLSTLEILPDWARKTFAAHETDERESTYSWEELARAKTADPLWNAAQTSLVIHGELHNNVRMTWGKAVLGWTRNAEEALEMLLDLNHRYALDGSDPNSWAGILWCLGLLDRPFFPERPILGSVRPRSSKRHAERMDMSAYERKVSRPARPDSPTVAVIGAGPAGLMAARTLRDHGLETTVFDKGRGPGGRTSTRRDADRSFDHGAPFFTLTDPRLSRLKESWKDQGLIAPWPAPSQEPQTWTAIPTMSALAKHLASDCRLLTNTRVTSLNRKDDEWWISAEQLSDEQTYGPFDAVIVAIPPEQAADLVSASAHLHDTATSVHSEAVWCAAITLGEGLSVSENVMNSASGPLSLAIKNSAKPGRDAGETWVLHARADWTAANMEAEREDVIANLCREFFDMVGCAPQEITHSMAHRWKYAQASNPLKIESDWDEELRLGLCGEWLHGGSIEGALLSGMAAAGRIVGMPPIRMISVGTGLQQNLFSLEGSK